MRNKAVLFMLTAVVALAASCDSGGKKAAFDQYESKVIAILEEEAELRTRYDEEFADMRAYGRLEKFDKLVRGEVIPFYDEMDQAVKAVSPEGEELERIHGLLLEYVALCREMFQLDTRSLEIGDMEKPVLDRLNKAMTERDKRTKEFNDALLAQPELMQRLAGMFTTEQQAALSVIQSLQAVRAGEIPVTEFLQYMDEQVDPFYIKLVEALSGMKVSLEEQAAMLKAKAYVGSTMAFCIAAREMAALRPKLDEQLVPLRERLQDLQQQTSELIISYREAAGAYRDSLP